MSISRPGPSGSNGPLALPVRPQPVFVAALWHTKFQIHPVEISTSHSDSMRLSAANKAKAAGLSMKDKNS